ncbi:BgTH12-00230 [Blumeria graminis f. sp. triticale]|nr:BgTH12-00230 [Blumeria graminis f. sp. triticale]
MIFNPSRLILIQPLNFRGWRSSSSSRPKQYGFIGLGQMGYNMAKTLQSRLPASESLRVFDINIATTQQLKKECEVMGGAMVTIATNARDAAENSEITITVLPECTHVKSVFNQVLCPLLSTDIVSNKDRLFIDCSTIAPTSSREIADLVRATHHSQFVDAPMSGGVVGANSGTLTFMLGSPDHLVSRVERVLLMMGKKVFHCGPQGLGLAGKLANNYLLAINNIATAEAMNLGIRWGLDPKLLSSLINTSTGKCWSSEMNNPVSGVDINSPASRDYAGGFGISLMIKDLNLAINGAREANASLELGDRAQEVYDAANRQDNCKGKDFSVIYRYLSGPGLNR